MVHPSSTAAIRSPDGENSPQEKGTSGPHLPLSTSTNCMPTRATQYMAFQLGENLVVVTGAAVVNPVRRRTSRRVFRSQILTSSPKSKASWEPSGDR